MDLDVKILPCGDTGLTVQLGNTIERRLSRRVVALSQMIQDAQPSGVLEIVPTYRSLTIHFCPLTTTHDQLTRIVSPLLDSLDDVTTEAGNAWRLPVCFEGPEFAPDLQHVADWAGMTKENVVNAVTSQQHYIYMLGFAPGQPYMGDLPRELAIPRRETPVARVPKGSVVIATGMTVIYPVENPTGWHVIGRTPASIFDAEKSSPALLSAGDVVSFFAVGAEEFQEFEERLSSEDSTTSLRDIS